MPARYRPSWGFQETFHDLLDYHAGKVFNAINGNFPKIGDPCI